MPPCGEALRPGRHATLSWPVRSVGPLADLRIVSCHLGAGASLAAVRGGVSLDTTMGFPPLAGLVMATRPGTLDPGLLLWLLEHGHVPEAELADVLEHHSGLKGLSGTDGDLRDVLAGRDAGDPACTLAFDVYLHRLCREAAAMTAAIGGLDVLLMTGGVGEHAWQVREAVAGALAYLGLPGEPVGGDRRVERPCGRGHRFPPGIDALRVRVDTCPRSRSSTSRRTTGRSVPSTV